MKLHFEIPKRCKECKLLENCARVRKFLNVEDSIEGFSIRWELMNECDVFEWNDELTRYDFTERA